MKKILVTFSAFSALFTGVVNAGGNLSPVIDIQEPEITCNDFYGSIGVGGIYNDAGAAHTTFGVFGVLGVDKEVFNGLRIGAEVQGASYGFNDASGSTRTDKRGNTLEQAALTQLNVTYQFENTALKIGRFALPYRISALYGTGGSYFDMKTRTFEGAMFSNTDIADTVVWGAYLYNQIDHKTSGWNGFNNMNTPSIGTSVKTRSNIVALGIKNRSFADTVINLSGYYGIDSKDYKVGFDADTAFDDTKISYGGAYKHVGLSGLNYSIVGFTAKQEFESAFIKVGMTYGDTEYKKYTDFTAHNGYKFDGKSTGKTWALGAKIGADFDGYKPYIAGNYQQGNTWEVSVGTSKKIGDIEFNIDYRRNSAKANRFRAKAVYKF